MTDEQLRDLLNGAGWLALNEKERRAIKEVNPGSISLLTNDQSSSMVTEIISRKEPRDHV